MMLMLNVPATIGLFVLATPIVQLLFERGRFLPADTAATAAAARFYAIGLVGYSAVRIASPTFYAIGDSRVPAMVSGAIAVNVIASVALVRAMGFEGGVRHVEADCQRRRARVAPAAGSAAPTADARPQRSSKSWRRQS
jgi:peptidoglycan biosynthesis protein MviN/MurJ (putative lipid II flippase)